jgi:outer membrane protein assembly factor BamB
MPERWYQSQSGYAWARPAVSGNVVYFGDGLGDVIARDVRTGGQVWIARAAEGPIDGANILVRGGVVVTAAQTHAIGLDAVTGRGLWRFTAPDDTVGVPPGYFAGPGSVWLATIDADDQTVYIPAWGASVSALDLHNGNVRWIWHPGRIEGDTATAGVFRSGAMGVRVSGDTVFATMWHYVIQSGVYSEAWLVAIDRLAGKELWRVRLPFTGGGTLVWAAPVFYQNLVIVQMLPAHTYAIDRTTQKVVWEFVAPAEHLSTTTAGAEVYGDVAYADGGDEQLHALRARDGSVIWNAPFPGSVTSGLLVTEHRVIFTNGNELMALDRQTGRMVARTVQPRTYDGLFSSAAAFSNGLVFITMAGAAWCIGEP